MLRAVYTRERVARSPGEVGQHVRRSGVRACGVVPERPAAFPGGAVPGVEDASEFAAGLLPPHHRGREGGDPGVARALVAVRGARARRAVGRVLIGA